MLERVRRHHRREVHASPPASCIQCRWDPLVANALALMRAAAANELHLNGTAGRKRRAPARRGLWLETQVCGEVFERGEDACAELLA